MAEKGKGRGVRTQLVVLGATGVLALVMAVVMVVHKPFMSKQPVVEETPEVVEEEPEAFQRLAAAPGPTEGPAISRTNLRSLLSKLSRTHSPARRKRLMEKARARMEEFEPFLLEVLGNENDPLILEAITLAGEFQIGSAALDLKVLTGAARFDVRAAAIRTFDILRAWHERDLRRFLEYDPVFPKHPLVLEAALDVCAWREDRPVDLIVPLLGHPDGRVKAAAVNAIPKLSSGKELENLCSFARRSEGLDARAAARALGRTYIPTEAEDCLGDLLRNDNWMVVEAALAALANKESQLQDVEPILEVLRDNNRSVKERLYGFIAMENTGTVPVDEINELLPSLHPILQLLAARCLVTVGERSGIAVLIGLLDTTRSASVDRDEQECVVSGAASVLKEVSGMSLGMESEPWREWYGELEEFGPIEVLTPAPTFW